MASMQPCRAITRPTYPEGRAMRTPSAPRGGFGLLEIVISVIVLGVLVAVISPSVFRHMEKARYQEVVDDLRTIEAALIRYYQDVGTLEPLSDIGGFTADPTEAAYRHFIGGDGERGWKGPYLDELKIGSSFGGSYDIDVFTASQASIDLGTRSRMGAEFANVLSAVDELLDEDGDTTRGIVWGDSNGIHFGFNFVKK
jgi:general secretion pathway protein G